MQSGERAALRLFVGQHFKGEPIVFVPEQFERYIAVGPSGDRNIEGKLGADAGSLGIKEPGRYVGG